MRSKHSSTLFFAPQPLFICELNATSIEHNLYTKTVNTFKHDFASGEKKWNKEINKENYIFQHDAGIDSDVQAYLIGIKLLVGKYCLFISHLNQVICCKYTFTALNVRRLFSMKGIYDVRGVKVSAQDESTTRCKLLDKSFDALMGDIRHVLKTQRV